MAAFGRLTGHGRSGNKAWLRNGLGGWRGYDEGTDAALATFAGALAGGRLDPDPYTFDLGAVVFEPGAAGQKQRWLAP